MSDAAGESLGGIFKEEPLTVRDHMDPDKHWIGETLPAPSEGEITYAGAETKVGESTFPARADHSHDGRNRYGAFRDTVLTGATAGVNVPAGGSAYSNNLNFWLGEDLRHTGSKQLIDIPQEGAWQFNCHYTVQRSSGSFVAGTAFQIRSFWNNAASSRTHVYQDAPIGHTVAPGNFTWIYYWSAPTATSNWQINCLNEDTVAVRFIVTQLDVRRLSAYGTAEVIEEE